MNRQKPNYLNIFISGLIAQNPISYAGLGLCSALAVTSKVQNAVAMGIGVIFVTVCSCFIISVFRKFILDRTRMAVYILIISSFVICVDLIIQSFFYDISLSLGPYVGLIITNCVVFGRAESFAAKNRPVASVFDALGHSTGYAIVLFAVSLIREVLGFGQVLGIKVTPQNFKPLAVMATSSGAFIALAVIIWILKSIQQKRINNNA